MSWIEMDWLTRSARAKGLSTFEGREVACILEMLDAFFLSGYSRSMVWPCDFYS